jgi:GNAT superfamily N-acetyltransferase
MNGPYWDSLETLSEKHPVNSFASGLEVVDIWFREKALGARHLVSTHVCLDTDNNIAAFYALRNVIVKTTEMTSAFRKNSDEQGNTTGILIAQMAVRNDLQQSGFGKELLKHIFKQVIEAYKISRFSLLIVEAANESLVGYYEKAGFSRVPNTLKLVFKMSSLERLIAESVFS